MRIDFLSHVYRFIDSRSGGNDAHVYLFFACQADACDEARAEVDHASVDARHVGVWIKHESHYRRTKGESRDGTVEKRRRSGFRQKFFFHPCGKESLNRIRRGVGCESQSLTKGDVEA